MSLVEDILYRGKPVGSSRLVLVKGVSLVKDTVMLQLVGSQ
jgi:hypothetical protein